MYSQILFFFFSSRRRHTRLTCDWSSDVCSSDLRAVALGRTPTGRTTTRPPRLRGGRAGPATIFAAASMSLAFRSGIGRASCRGRGENYGGGGAFKKKKQRGASGSDNGVVRKAPE